MTTVLLFVGLLRTRFEEVRAGAGTGRRDAGLTTMEYVTLAGVIIAGVLVVAAVIVAAITTKANSIDLG